MVLTIILSAIGLLLLLNFWQPAMEDRGSSSRKSYGQNAKTDEYDTAMRMDYLMDNLKDKISMSVLSRLSIRTLEKIAEEAA